MRRFLATTFLGPDEGLRILLATQSRAAGAEILPGVRLFFIGPGGGGKSLLDVTLASAIWDAGIGCSACSILQAEEEFRRQRIKYLEKKWLSFDECRPYSGNQEGFSIIPSMAVRYRIGETTKRRRHGAWPRSGRWWDVDDGDIPYISTDAANTFARRIRCIRMRPKKVFSASDSDENNRIFAVDPSPRGRLASPEVRRMARRILHTPTNKAKVANEEAHNSASNVIVKETHDALRARDTHQEIPPEYAINKFPAPSNYGAQPRTAQRVEGGTKRRALEAETRQDVLDKRIADFPYLIKKTQR